jgi:hypothetical protein
VYIWINIKGLFGQLFWKLESRQVYAVSPGDGNTGMAEETMTLSPHTSKRYFLSQEIQCGRRIGTYFVSWEAAVICGYPTR